MSSPFCFVLQRGGEEKHNQVLRKRKHKDVSVYFVRLAVELRSLASPTKRFPFIGSHVSPLCASPTSTSSSNDKILNVPFFFSFPRVIQRKNERKETKKCDLKNNTTKKSEIDLWGRGKTFETSSRLDE